MSSSGYCELPSSLGQETEGLGPSKLSGSVHRSAKQTRSQRRVTFDGYLRPIMKVQIPGPCTTESVEHVPPEIELPDATTHTQAASEAIENVEPLERFQILVRLGFDAYFRGSGSTLAPRHFWVHEDMDEGHILLWVDCERTSLKGRYLCVTYWPFRAQRKLSSLSGPVRAWHTLSSRLPGSVTLEEQARAAPKFVLVIRVCNVGGGVLS